jgi:hypothetical protein
MNVLLQNSNGRRWTSEKEEGRRLLERSSPVEAFLERREPTNLATKRSGDFCLWRNNKLLLNIYQFAMILFITIDARFIYYSQQIFIEFNTPRFNFKHTQVFTANKF